MRNLRHESAAAGFNGRTGGQIEACHGRGHIFLHFRCEIARAVRSWPRGSGEHGAWRTGGRSDITITLTAARHFLFRLLCFPVICSQPPPAPAPPPARRSATFRLPQGICSPIGGRVASRRRVARRNRETDGKSEGRPSDDPPAKGYSEIEEATRRASERGKPAGLTAASLIFSTKVLSPLCQEWSECL